MPSRKSVLVTLAAAALIVAAGAAAYSAADKPGDRVKALREEKLAVLKEINVMVVKSYQAGQGNAGAVHRSRLDLLEAQLELCETPAQRLKLHEEIVAEAQMWETTITTMAKGGQAPVMDALEAKVFRLQTQIALEQARADAKK